jgi:methionyl-tRNA formyltransferase
MRIVFFGTPEFAVPSLEALIDLRESVPLVVTQPDRPRGRSRSNLQPSPVKARAESLAIPVLQPDRPRGDDFIASLRALEPDLGVVVAYGHILKPEVLAVPRFGMINVHASLLPRWRGAAPIQWAIASGDSSTGVTIMEMEAGLDSGPIIATRELPIGPDDTGGKLTKRLAKLGAEALRAALSGYSNGRPPSTPQDDAFATYAPKIDHGVARIDWNQDARAVGAHIRAFDPTPGAWTERGSLELKCFSPSPEAGDGAPGTVLSAEGRLVIATAGGAVAIGEVKPSGKPRMPAAAWLRGRPIAKGDVFR